MKPSVKKATAFAFLAALLYALNAPLSKLLLERIEPTMLASLLYLGAGVGMLTVRALRACSGRPTGEAPLTPKEWPYAAAMILLDIAAPVSLMLGLKSTTAAHASLLNNFEIVTTALIALLLFREAISRRLWLAIALVTLAGGLLSFEGGESLRFSGGSLLVLLACAFWGLENNCTRKLSSKDPTETVVLKGLGSGLGALLLSLSLGERFHSLLWVSFALLLGFVAYGLSITFYIYAQRDLGAAKTGTYYAVAPFLGCFLSLLLFAEWPSPTFLVALALMLGGAYLAATDRPGD